MSRGFVFAGGAGVSCVGGTAVRPAVAAGDDGGFGGRRRWSGGIGFGVCTQIAEFDKEGE